MRNAYAALDRRAALRWIGAGLFAVPALKLLACDTQEPAIGDAADGSDSSNETTDTTPTETISADAWATGGTAAMTAKSSYPDPFTSGAGTSCELQCQTTIGPCHTTSPEREDVSDGWDGLPVRLELRLVDAACQPIEGSVVEIWHTNYEGIYSGRINTMCNSDEADRAAQYFRGYQVTGADGRVAFDTCFPGWYSGRVVHIHYRVQTGAYAASDSAAATVISQLFFDSTLVAAIFGSEPHYRDFGQPDTTLSSDNIIGGAADKTPYILDTVRTSDGAMLASKTLVVRTDDTANCSVSSR